MESALRAPVLFGGGPAAWEGRDSRAEERPGCEGCADEDGSRWSAGGDVAILRAVQCRPALPGSTRAVRRVLDGGQAVTNAVEPCSVHPSRFES